MGLSEATIINHNKQVIADVRKHNKGVAESNKRSLSHELNCAVKDTTNYDFKGMKHYIGGFGDKKEKLSHKIYRLQCRLNKESKTYRAIATALRKTKNFFSGMFRSQHIPGLPRIFK